MNAVVNVSSVSLVPFSVSELEVSVDKLQKEAEQLREQRNQQKQLADSSARQRDMYKALLTQSTGYSLPAPGHIKHTHTHRGLYGELVLNNLCNAALCLCGSTGPDSTSLPAHVRPSVPATRSTPQRAAATESAQTAQAKAALKQVHMLKPGLLFNIT